MGVLSDFPQVGDLFQGRYQIESVLGTGGYARVYRALQVDLDRQVAVKVMRPVVDSEESNTEETLAQIELIEERFRREAKVISKFRSPCTVVVHDYGRTSGGLLFMTLEYVDGQTLSDLITAEAPLEPVRVVNIIRQVLESLHEAHSFDILHRDIKPQNVMVFDHLDTTDLVKVLDFGIAKVLEVEEEAAAVSELTSDGVLIGTPRYMSPEQIRGDRLGPTSDIYSLGLVAYEMLTAEKAVPATTTMRIIAQHLSPQPLSFPTKLAVPPRLRAIIERMIAKDSTQRHSSARVLLDALDEWPGEVDLAAMAPQPTGRFLEESTDPSVTVPPFDQGDQWDDHRDQAPADDEFDGAETVLMNLANYEDEAGSRRLDVEDSDEGPFPSVNPWVPVVAVAMIALGLAIGSAMLLRNTPRNAQEQPGVVQREEQPSEATGAMPSGRSQAAYDQPGHPPAGPEPSEARVAESDQVDVPRPERGTEPPVAASDIGVAGADDSARPAPEPEHAETPVRAAEKSAPRTPTVSSKRRPKNRPAPEPSKPAPKRTFYSVE